VISQFRESIKYAPTALLISNFLCLLFLAIAQTSCTQEVYMTMLKNPDTGDVQICRSDIGVGIAGEGSSGTAHTQCEQKLMRIGYYVVHRTGN
jgi:hypothetical protein